MKAPLRFALFATTLGAAFQAQSAILTVCSSGCSYATPSQAYASSVAGDTIQIRPGTYNDCIYILKSNITIEGVDGRPVMEKRVCGQKGIIVTAGQNTTIRNIELRGATNGSNYAGIRHDRAGFNLTLDNVYVHTNDMGLLSSSVGDTVTIKNSFFENNGMNDNTNGMAHNIYMNTSAVVNFINSKSIRSKLGGHEFKTRAMKTVIDGSVIATMDGTDSRLIDVSNGGELVVRNSVLQKRTPGNNDMIGYGPEGIGSGRTNSVTITGNKVISDRSNGQLIRFFNPASSIDISSNVLVALASITNSGTPTDNMIYSSRSQAGYAAYPYLPEPVQAPTEPTPPTASDPNWVRCANENGTCSFTGTRNVRYGANGSYVTKSAVTGPVTCTTANFGSDPANGMAKACDYSVAEVGPVSTFVRLKTQVNATYCGDVSSTLEGTQAKIWQCLSGNANQKFEVVTATGEIKVRGKCLDATTGTSGTLVTVRTCNGGVGQKWAQNTATGEIKGINGLCLDLAGAATNGTKIQAATCSGSTGQKWNLTAY